MAGLKFVQPGQQYSSASAVSVRLRVERTNSLVPRALSSRLRAALATAGEMSSARAAADRLPLSAVRTNSCRSSMRSIFKIPLKEPRLLPCFSAESNKRASPHPKPNRSHTMKAVAYYQSYPVEHPQALLDIELPEPVPGPRDLLVEVRAI